MDRVSQAQLDQGYRLTELLKQAQSAPVPVEEQVLVIYAGTGAGPTRCRSARCADSPWRWWSTSRANHPAVLEAVRTTGNLPGGDEIDKGLTTFLEGFDTGRGRLIDGRRPKAHSAAPHPRCAVHEEDPTKAMGLYARPLADRARPEPHCGEPSYREGMERVLRLTAAADPRAAAKLLGTPESPRHVGILAIVGDRGLAGSYNSGVLRATERRVAELRSNGAEVTVWSVGKKAPAYLRYRGIDTAHSFLGFADAPQLPTPVRLRR